MNHLFKWVPYLWSATLPSSVKGRVSGKGNYDLFGSSIVGPFQIMYPFLLYPCSVTRFENRGLTQPDWAASHPYKLRISEPFSTFNRFSNIYVSPTLQGLISSLRKKSSLINKNEALQPDVFTCLVFTVYFPPFIFLCD